MNFSELETLMSSRGVTTLAEIARTLNTTPQAVSNWKARNQVPHHIAAKLSQLPPTGNPQTSDGPPIHSSPVTHYALPSIFEEETISFSDILVAMAEQLKVILLVPFITVFFTFTHVQFIQQPYYLSSSKLLLPENQGNSGGIAGLASQFGVSLSQGVSADLSSPSLFPELIKSRTFAERVLKSSFYTEQYDKELSLLAILTHGDAPPTVGIDTLIQNAIIAFQGMVSFENEGSFSVLTVRANEPRFARDINKVILVKLKELNLFFRSQNVSQKVSFINNRITAVEKDLESYEQSLKLFREQNRQISSPALQLQEERLIRSVEIQKGIYLTLKQQLELANIEKIQEETVVQILDEPMIPLNESGKNLKLNVLLSGILGLGLGILLGFVRTYLNNSDIDERKKLRRIKNFLKKKSKELIMDRRVLGIVSVLLLIGLPYYIGHTSKNPVFFGMYSTRLMFINTIYVLTLLISSALFIYITFKKIDK